ncbi:VOC family protein [Ekhidna sp.]|uniref:VOC family protein n=1 Tax=Ekhidna sp. TaxID=2608089 RepID=UPI003B5AB0D5
MKIKELTLYTSKLKEVEPFYTDLLGIELLDSSQDSIKLKVGETNLIFEQSEQSMYYHFAINIPSYQIGDALNWIKSKTKVLPFHGDEIVDFKSWNAEALYFYDPAGNIVELIARKNLKISSVDNFDASSFQHISEIGLPVADVNSTFNQFEEECGLLKFSGDYERFCAVGSETGLFITIDYNQKDWIPNDDKAHSFPFSCVIENDRKRYGISYPDENLIITPK